MTSSDCDVIMIKLEHLGDMLNAVHEEVKRTNGRVTELELESAEWRGRAASRRVYQAVATTVVSGCVLAGVVWFFTNSIN